MPCDTIQTTTVEFGAKTDTVLLSDALTALNYSGIRLNKVNGNISGDWVSFNKETGELSLRLSNASNRIRDIKREYSKQVVVSQSAKFGFKLVPLEGKKEVRHVRV